MRRATSLFKSFNESQGSHSHWRGPIRKRRPWMSHSWRWSNRSLFKGNTGFQYLVEKASVAPVLAANALSEGHSFCAVHLARSNELGPFRFLKASFFYDTDGIASLLGECHYLIA